MAALGGGAVLVIVGLWLAATRYLPALDEARALRTDLVAMADRARAAGVELDRPTLLQLQAELKTADGHLADLRDLLASDPLVGLARSFPPTRDAVRGADAVVAAGGDLTAAAADGLTIADQYVTIREAQAATPTTGGSTLAGLVELMATSQSTVNAAIAALNQADQTLAAAPASLPGPIADARDAMRAKIAEYGPPLKAYAHAAGILPDMLGWSGPRRYLVLTQDPAELRPTGGFIGSFGIIAFDKGKITERHFQDVFLLDLPWKYPFITAPGPLSRYLLGPKQPWQLADSNWSPDFPTSAADAIRLYRNEGGSGQVDGVFGLTTYTIDQLLTLTGPITVPEYRVTIASGETTLKTLQLTRAPRAPDQNRKAFLSTFADRLFGTLLALSPHKWADLAGQADLFRTQRLFSTWFADPAAEALSVDAGFDGAVLQSAGDYLYPVDSNVAPASKLNAVTDRALDLSVQLDHYGNAHDNLDIAWTNLIQTDLGAPYRALPTLQNLDVLGLYFRLLVPDRSRIDSVSGGSYERLTAPADIGAEAGREVIGNYLRVPPGTTHLRYAWVSPYAADSAADGTVTYRLTIQKQPGLRAGPLHLSIAVPPGAVLVDASAGLTVRGGTVTLDVTFDRDLVLAIRYRMPAVTP
ncbi:MAG: DUF4012 domain-containing protein [Chloroflexi bacterium]|nr:DUF4012 domain-containing protein [Chloroflexota bacterium]